MTFTIDDVTAKLRSRDWLPMKEHAADYVAAGGSYDLPEDHESRWVDSYGDTVLKLFEDGTYAIGWSGDDEPFDRGSFSKLMVMLDRPDDE